jgi:hypothetical protein
METNKDKISIHDIDRDKLIELFSKYGYKTEEEDKGNFIVFSLQTGMYPAIEIVPYRNDIEPEIKEIKENYSKSGYAVKITQGTTISEIENYLFNGFFHVEMTNKRITQKYIDYANTLMEIYDKDYTAYQYINIPYSLEFNFEKKASSGKLIDSILSFMKSDRPSLIIVEAAAGFGKTSTAYELLKSYSTVTENVRPFLMELSKDRTASNFRYLLLSQIEQNFDTLLKNDIVIYNIKQGRIPLIIDGFDELLSKDIDDGASEAKFSDVETMLSTIADLLTNKSKVILTTRKTAIFAGENFADWVYSKTDDIYDFDVIRYQLDSPSIEDWLDSERYHILPQNLTNSLSNPVLLGYLRYIDDDEFYKVANNSSTLVNSYFKFLLTREIKRQDLPFSVEEQKKILRKLASCFAGYNITSDTRTHVKETIKELADDLITEKATTQKDAESLSNALTNHALLDRKGNCNVGFLNDFILGTLFMESIEHDEDNTSLFFHKEASFPFIEKAILAASVWSESTRKFFWKKLIKHCVLNDILQFWADVKLLDQTMSSFSNEAFDGGKILNATIGDTFITMDNCCFSNIIFESCIFDFNSFKNCSFINCTFLNCHKLNTNIHCDFYNCNSNDFTFIDENTIINIPIELELSEQAEDALIKEILSMYLKVDGKTRRMRMISKLRETFKIEEKSFKKNFNVLTKKGYIICNGDKSFITDEGIEYLQNN